MSFEDWPSDIETLIDEKVDSAINEHRETSVTDDPNFDSSVRSIAEDVVEDADIDGRVEHYIEYNLDFTTQISDEVENALSYRSFTSEDVEDFDSAVEYVVADLEQRVTDLEEEVQTLVETNKRLLAALLGEDTQEVTETPATIALSVGETVPAFSDFTAAAI